MQAGFSGESLKNFKVVKVLKVFGGNDDKTQVVLNSNPGNNKRRQEPAEIDAA